MQHSLTDFYWYWFLQVSTPSKSYALVFFLNALPTTVYSASIQAQQILCGYINNFYILENFITIPKNFYRRVKGTFRKILFFFYNF